jgi:hypothetical protein
MLSVVDLQRGANARSTLQCTDRTASGSETDGCGYAGIRERNRRAAEESWEALNHDGIKLNYATKGIRFVEGVEP